MSKKQVGSIFTELINLKMNRTNYSKEEVEEARNSLQLLKLRMNTNPMGSVMGSTGMGAARRMGTSNSQNESRDMTR